MPQHVVVYRDGVGDGQLQSLLDQEFVQLLTAFKMVDPNMYEDGLMLNCDISLRVLRTTTVLEEPNFKQTAQDVLVGLCVLTLYNNEFYCIDDILFDKNPQSTFDCQGIQMMFLEYYKKHYGIEIKDKCQPLLLNRFG